MAPNLTVSEWAMLPFQLCWLWTRIGLCYLEALYRVFVPLPAKSIRSKVVLITGAGRGIGREMTLKFAAQGARLALWDVMKSNVEETAEIVKSTGGTAYAYACDITSVAAVKEMAAKVRKDLGDVDIVVNNAGIMITKRFMALTESDIRRTFDINIIAHFWILQEFLPAMIERNEGHVVTIASMAGRSGVPLLTDYCGSKWAAVGFSEALAEELRIMKKDIKMSIVYPMFVNTNLVNDVSDRAKMRNKFGRLLEAEEVAEAVVNGVRHNQRHIYVPPQMGNSVILGVLLPQKAKHILVDFIDAGFQECS